MKILFIGPMGAGKTTAIAAVSDIEPISTEARNNDKEGHSKETTTVAMDYGEIRLDGGEVVSLCGIPGQMRFSFMWPILAEGAMGAILLLNGSEENSIIEANLYLDAFERLASQGAVVIGVRDYSLNSASALDPYYKILKERDLALPVFVTDVRDKVSVLLLIESLIASIEVNEMSGA